MKNLRLEIDDEVMDVNIPENFSEITVDKFSKLYLSFNQDDHELTKSIKMVAMFLDLPIDTVKLFPEKKFLEICEILSFISKTEITTPPKDSIVINGQEFWTKKDFNNITVGEKYSIQILLEQHDNNLYACMAKVLCIFLRKRKENGKLEAFKNEHMDRAGMFGQISIEDVYLLFSFFLPGKTEL